MMHGAYVKYFLNFSITKNYVSASIVNSSVGLFC
jgi:hypothetical protein